MTKLVKHFSLLNFNVLLSVATSILSIAFFFQEKQDIIVTQDTVWYQFLFSHYFSTNYSFSQLSGPPTTYLFPDVIFHFIIFLFFDKDPSGQIVFGFIQMILLSTCLTALLYQLLNKFKVSFISCFGLIPFLFAFSAVFCDGLSNFFFFFIPQYHVCFFIGLIASYALAIRMQQNRRYLKIYFLAIILFALSSKLYLANYILPSLALASLLLAVKKINFPEWFTFVMTSCVAVATAFFLDSLIANFLFQTTNSFNKGLAFGDFQLSTFYQILDWIIYLMDSQSTYQYYLVRLILLAYLLNISIALFFIFKLCKQKAPLVSIQNNKIILFTIFCSLVPIFNTLSIILYGHLASWYAIGIWTTPIIWLMFFLIYYIYQSKLLIKYCQTLTTFILSLMVFCLLISFPKGITFWPLRLDVITCVEKIAAKHNLTHGISLSSYSSVVNTYSKENIKLIKVYPDLRLRPTEALLDLYFEDPPGVNKKASIDFILTNGINPQNFKMITTKIKTTETCSYKSSQYKFIILKKNNKLGFNKKLDTLSDKNHH